MIKVSKFVSFFVFVFGDVFMCLFFVLILR